MKLHLILVGACLASAVDMSRYAAGPGVEFDFADYLKELYKQTEILEATTSLTDFFTPEGKLIVLEQTYGGPDDIIRKKRQLLPLNGIIHWNHFPNMTSVYSETDTEKVYMVLGVNDRIITGVNCSAAYYATRFHIMKNSDGMIDLRPHAGNLRVYDDYVIDPSFVPTNIPCAR